MEPKKRRPEQRKLSTEENIMLLEKMTNENKSVRVKYNHINTKKYLEALEERKRRLKAIMLITAIICVLALTFGISACIGSSIGANEKKEDNAVEVSKEVSESKESAIAAVTEISDKPEPIDTKPKYSIDHTYKTNTSRLSKDVMKELDEEISAEFVALYDVTADEFIYLKNGTKKCYPASTTKILTAVVASQIITDPQTVITVGDEIKMIGEDSSVACLEEGMQLTFEMLLDALLLPSGNDAAYTIAVNCGRIYSNDKNLSNEEAVKVFEELVNDAAKKMGADGTHFVTPDGWHDDDHYTTAVDLVKFGDYARTIPVVKSSYGKNYAEWKLVKGGVLGWDNSNKLIRWDTNFYSEYCDGIKTGFTDQAGTSVVASATMDGHTFIVAVMNANNLYSKYEDCHKMFTYAFKLYGKEYTWG